MKAGGAESGMWLKLPYDFLDSETMRDLSPACLKLYIHCLLSASRKNRVVGGEPVARGAFISSVRQLERDTGISHATVQKSLKILNEKELILSYSKRNGATVIHIVDFERYL